MARLHVDWDNGHLFSAFSLLITIAPVGAQPPSSEWGAMLTQGRQFFLEAWWLTDFPGLAIFVTVLIFNAAGVRLRTRLAM